MTDNCPSPTKALVTAVCVTACALSSDDLSAQTASPPLHYVTTAEQVGPVGYRDPIGAMSPDGRWLAYSSARGFEVQPVVGGPVTQFGSPDRDARELAWLADSRHVAIRERLFDRSAETWRVYDASTGAAERLWAGRRIRGTAAGTGAEVTALPDELRDLAWSSDGRLVAGVRRTGPRSELWLIDADGRSATVRGFDTRISHPAWVGGDGGVACLWFQGERQRVSLDCQAPLSNDIGDHEAYGPIAFDRSGRSLYYAAPNDRGTLDLWHRRTDGSPTPTRLTAFARDAYAPSVSQDGVVLFKLQDYRVFIAVTGANGGSTTPITAFQSETPSWDWTSSKIGFTYGSWRRVIDDYHYPDIAQHIGIVDVEVESAAAAPDVTVRSSYSEDQAMNWSPNGKWIALHTHADGSDDIWLKPADLSQPARPISRDGHETGWPRWSPDGRWILYPSYRRDERGARYSRLYVIGVDQETGEITVPQYEVPLTDFDADALQAEWAPDSERLVFEAAAGPGKKELYVVSRRGGAPRKIHEFDSEQLFSGITVSPDFRWVAYVTRAADGYFQIFRVSTSGGEPEQLTRDPSHKTQPSYSPDGTRLAFTVFRYGALFWTIRPGE